MSSGNNPCKGCIERHQACHSDCEKYAEWKHRYDEEKIEYYKEKNKMRMMDQYVINNNAKIKSSKKRSSK